MKKIFTLFLTLFVLGVAAFSQTYTKVSFSSPAVSINFSSHRYVDVYSFTRYDRDVQLSRINAAYNQQVNEVMRLRINASRKVDLIQQLQRERDSKICSINDRFSDYRNRYNNDYYNRDFGWRR
jgi:hypothetical protein